MGTRAEQKIAEEAAAREARIQLYAERAAAGLGIFTGEPIPKDEPEESEDSEE